VRSLLLVHGSGSGPWAFDGWADDFPHAEVRAVDLQEGLDVAHATVADYAAAVVRAANDLPRPLALVGWSLGGLVSLVASAEVRPERLVLLEASPPLEVQGLRPEIVPAPGTFDPVEAGAQPPPGVPVRRESALAMGERDRGVSVPPLPAGTRLLCVAGRAYLDERAHRLAALYGGEALDAGDVSHSDVVRSPQVRRQIAAWLSTSEPSA
jgi:pimeloyl-ACP methyl ester carboxylesterase